MPEAPLTLAVLIRTIRSARTQAEERDLVQRESAKIRGAFRGDEAESRATNLAKLLYIHMLGYPAHFGQMECLQAHCLAPIPRKRIGYLGAALLLDEKQDTHLLLTNSIKNDLLHSSSWVQGLALSTLGSLGSAAMFRDLAGEVEQLARKAQPSVRRKAVVCAVHIIRKVPDLTDMFIPLGKHLLTEQTYGKCLLFVLLMNLYFPSFFLLLQHVSQMVGVLRNLVVAGYSPDHSISGISNPFLQVQILRLLRILGRDNEDTSEAMNDTLAQVATNTETTRNVGNAILYETVLTIMGVQSTSGLRVLAINILGRFLLNKDRNIRYVALTSLQKLLQTENSAVQRHRDTVLSCLSDPDPTVKRRALQLSLALVSNSNVRTSVRLLCVSLRDAGWYVRDDCVPNLICLIGGAKELHSYAVQQLYGALVQDISQQPLVQVATWCIGEYGNLLLDGSCEEVEPKQVHPEEILSLLERVLQSHLSLPATRAYALTALMKLGTHLQDSDVNRIRSLVSIYCSCHDIELQQRAVEYNALFRKYDHLRYCLHEKVFSCFGWEAVGGFPHQADGISSLSYTVTPSATSLLDFLGDLNPAGKHIGKPLNVYCIIASCLIATALPRMSVYERDGLLIEFSMERPALEPTLLLITATVSNQMPDDIPNFTLQVAVPKPFQVELLPPSGSTVPGQGGAPLTQVIRVWTPKQVRTAEDLQSKKRV
uniref:AP-1 complex subunit gamma n=1 Tax=Anolis carolinensis TaxID=28377 RepID=A0A803U1C4_ANOCA